MAGKAKSCYLTVTPKASHKAVFHKMFFNMGDLNKFIATEEFQAKFPATEFLYVKEVY